MRNLCGELVLKDVHRSLRMPLLLGNWFLAWNLFAVTMVSGQDMLNELDSPRLPDADKKIKFATSKTCQVLILILMIISSSNLELIH
ncbi:hypothetical protein M8J77_011985 [Diaphorina citri]|nr:hypothetical protein M8J77_011985 [Diaphorina citri]